VGILQFGENLGTLTSTIANSSAAMVIDTNGFNGTISGDLTASNAGGLTKLGLGTLTLSGSNAYTGLTSVNAGALSLGSANALAGGGTITFGGGTLQFTGNNTADYSARIAKQYPWGYSD